MRVDLYLSAQTAANLKILRERLLDLELASVSEWFSDRLKAEVERLADIPRNKFRVEIERLVLLHFNGDKKKLRRWMSAKNPMFGGASANDLIKLGRGNKVLKCVKIALSENKR